MTADKSQRCYFIAVIVFDIKDADKLIIEADIISDIIYNVNFFVNLF